MLQSNLTIMNPLGTTEKVHYIRVFTISGVIISTERGVRSDFHVCLISGSSLCPGFIIVRFDCIYIIKYSNLSAVYTWKV